MKELALHLLDIAENGVTAQARNITIAVAEDTLRNRLQLSVQDDGKGMDPETLARVVDPFVTSRTTRKVGLGIPLLKAAAEACNGELHIQSELGKGTRLDVDFELDHIDRMPLGDLSGTCLTLLVGYPNVHWVFKYAYNQEEFIFDDQTVKQELAGIPLSDPVIIGYLRDRMIDGFSRSQTI